MPQVVYPFNYPLAIQCHRVAVFPYHSHPHRGMSQLFSSLLPLCPSPCCRLSMFSRHSHPALLPSLLLLLDIPSSIVAGSLPLSPPAGSLPPSVFAPGDAFRIPTRPTGSSYSALLHGGPTTPLAIPPFPCCYLCKPRLPTVVICTV